MTSKDFDFRRIAEGYKNRPFLHRQVIERFQKDVTDQTFSNGLDIGCGAHRCIRETLVRALLIPITSMHKEPYFDMASIASCNVL